MRSELKLFKTPFSGNYENELELPVASLLPACRQSIRDSQFDLHFGWMSALVCSRQCRFTFRYPSFGCKRIFGCPQAKLACDELSKPQLSGIFVSLTMPDHSQGEGRQP
jgi:hypothetical protein